MLGRVRLVICTILLVLFVLPAQAAQRDGLSLRVDCGGFSAFGGTLTLDRDNTGSGREAFQISAVDGDGNVLYAGPIESFLVGGAVDFPLGYRITYTTAAVSNPITVSIISVEGNGLRAQTVYTTKGRCAGLPTVEEVIPLVTTSPSLPLNTVPSLSNNAPTMVAGEPGVLIVNTAFLNLRSGDGPEYTLVGRVAGGARLIPLGRNADFTWWYVQAGDVVGWVLGELVIARGNFLGVPLVEPAGVIGLPRFLVYSTTNLLTLPDANSAPVCELAGNLEYEATAQNAGASFFFINGVCTDGTTAEGWIPAELGALRNPGSLVLPLK